VSPRAVPRRDHLSRQSPRGGVAGAGSCRHMWLVGKPSTMSNRNRSWSISFLAELSSCLGDFHSLGSFPSAPQQDVHLGRLLCARQIRSVELRLLRSSCDTATVRSISKPFSGNDLSRGISSTSLTRRCLEQKIAARSGTSKRSSLCKSPNGPVEGLSPEIVESAA